MNYLEKTDQNEKRHRTRFLRNDNWPKKKYLRIRDQNSEINTKCEFYESDNTTQHLSECPILRRQTQEEMKAINLETVDSMQEIRRIAKYIERVNEIKTEITRQIQLRYSVEQSCTL